MIIKPIDITDQAIEKIWEIIWEKKIPDIYGLRVELRRGGCTGTMTKMLGFDTKNERDLEYELHGITLYLDKSHAMFLTGTTIDYYSDGNEEGFIFLDQSTP